MSSSTTYYPKDPKGPRAYKEVAYFSDIDYQNAWGKIEYKLLSVTGVDIEDKTLSVTLEIVSLEGCAETSGYNLKGRNVHLASFEGEVTDTEVHFESLTWETVQFGPFEASVSHCTIM